jgi:hypothetical protein
MTIKNEQWVTLTSIPQVDRMVRIVQVPVSRLSEARAYLRDLGTVDALPRSITTRCVDVADPYGPPTGPTEEEEEAELERMGIS